VRRPTARLLVHGVDPRRPTAAVDIVIPVYNEAVGLEGSVRQLNAYLRGHFPLTWRITIADNASTDGTWGLACRLATELSDVVAARLEQKGRGRALRATWAASASPVVAYMDVDLSTDVDALLPLVAPLVTGHSDLAIGTRLVPGARVVRGPKREAISRSYNLILRVALHSGFSDAQCGFKAARADAVRRLLPLIEDDGWFFDTELLVLAEHNGMRIHEVAVDWVDDPDSRVHIVSTATADLLGLWRLLRSLPSGRLDLARRGRAAQGVPDADLAGQLVRFGSIGAVTTIGFAILFGALAGSLGGPLAVVLALLACSAANTPANRRLTFALRGRAGAARHHLGGLAVAMVSLVALLSALGVLDLIGATSLTVRLATLTAVNLAATLGRFVALRHWVFGGGRDRP